MFAYSVAYSQPNSATADQVGSNSKGQTDASPSSSNSSISRRHRLKPHSISTGSAFKHMSPITHHIKPPPRRSSKMKTSEQPQQPQSPTTPTRPSGMIETEKSRSRKERTYVGEQCAACEESLEHKLSGEKVIQFSCGHFAHEACLYEYIKDEDEEEQFCPECEEPLILDTARGGNVLDLNKLGSMVRRISQQPPDELSPAQPSFSSAKTWDGTTIRDSGAGVRNSYPSAHDAVTEQKDGHVSKIEKFTDNNNYTLQHENNISNSHRLEEGTVDGRKHDYDLAAMESKTKQLDHTKNIPRPKVTIRSEFPTITRSKQQQSLTCLVTVEVPASRTPVRQVGGQHPLSAIPRLSTETPQALEAVAKDLINRVDNWHGLETDKFGPLRLHNNIKVGRDGNTWQKLDCFLFSELLICVREKRVAHPAIPGTKPRFQLKGSILIQQHLTDVSFSADDIVLTLSLGVATLPTFRMKFTSREQLDVWRLGLLQLELVAPCLYGRDEEHDTSGTEDEEFGGRGDRPTSIASSTQSGSNTVTTTPTDYNDCTGAETPLSSNIHVPVDIVVVIPVSSSMQGLKIKLLKDALRFLITHLGEHDRMGLVTFGAHGGANPLVSMATKDWYGWRDIYRSIKPVGQKALRADPVEGTNVAMDLLSKRKDANPVSSILLISDSPTNDHDSVDFVVKRAHKANVSINAFGLGQTHKADNLIELASRTNAPYVYVKDWMMLRECVAGCLGSLQSTSHTSAKLRLKIPEGSVAKFVKVSGALHATKRSSGRDAEAILGDLRFGDKRDILVQLSVDPDSSMNGDPLHDHWESIVNGLVTLDGSIDDHEQRPQSVEEIPLIQADLSYGDFAKNGATAHLSHPSLLTITLLPENPQAKRSSRGSIIPPMPSHPSVVQRRMEMLTSDMLTRALTLTSKGQHDSAHRLLKETRTILQGLGKGSLPPLPPAAKSGQSRSSSVRKDGRSTSRDGRSTPKEGRGSPRIPPLSSGRASPKIPEEKKSNSSLASLASLPPNFPPPIPRSAANIDPKLLHALNHDIETCMEFIDHPAVFSHDAKKAALQTIGIISSQRAYTFRTETESYWASRIKGVRKMGEIIKDWQMVGNDTLAEEM